MQVFDFDKRFCIANDFYAGMVFLFFSWFLPFQRGERKQREENRDEKRWQRGEAMLIPRSELGDSERFPTFYGFPLLDSTAATRLSTVGDDNDFVSNNSSPLD